jgi:hypothetical protein
VSVDHALEDVDEIGVGLNTVEFGGFNQRANDRPSFAAVRRDVMMPGVCAVRLSWPIRSIRYSGSPPLLSPIRCMAALVI